MTQYKHKIQECIGRFRSIRHAGVSLHHYVGPYSTNTNYRNHRVVHSLLEVSGAIRTKKPKEGLKARSSENTNAKRTDGVVDVYRQSSRSYLATVTVAYSIVRANCYRSGLYRTVLYVLTVTS